MIKPSDLRYKYLRNKAARDLPQFVGKPDARPFDRDNLYEVLNMFEVVMKDLGSQSADVLEVMEELLVHDMPLFLQNREEVYDFLFFVMQQKLEYAAG